MHFHGIMWSYDGLKSNLYPRTETSSMASVTPKSFIDIDDIGEIEDLLRVVFINEECGNLKVFADGGELTRNINEKKKPDILQT